MSAIAASLRSFLQQPPSPDANQRAVTRRDWRTGTACANRRALRLSLRATIKLGPQTTKPHGCGADAALFSPQAVFRTPIPITLYWRDGVECSGSLAQTQKKPASAGSDGGSLLGLRLAWFGHEWVFISPRQFLWMVIANVKVFSGYLNPRVDNGLRTSVYLIAMQITTIRKMYAYCYQFNS